MLSESYIHDFGNIYFVFWW